MLTDRFFTPPRFRPDRRVVAVTGAAGFLGGEVLRRLCRDPRAYRLLAVDKDFQRLERLPGPGSEEPPGSDKIERCPVDLTRPDAAESLLRLFAMAEVDTVLHLALRSSPSRDDARGHELDCVGTMQVLRAASGYPVRKVVLASQTLVYGPSPQNPNHLSEGHPLRGLSGSSFVTDKLEVEEQARRLRMDSPNMQVTVLRMAPLLGPTVKNFATRLLSRAVAPVLLGQDPLVQLLHERDAVQALLLALGTDAPGVFNIASRGVLPWSTVLALLGRIPVPLPHALARPLLGTLWALRLADAPPEFLDLLRYLCVADTRKARQQLGFFPRYDLVSTLEEFEASAEPTGLSRAA